MQGNSSHQASQCPLNPRAVAHLEIVLWNLQQRLPRVKASLHEALMAFLKPQPCNRELQAPSAPFTKAESVFADALRWEGWQWSERGRRRRRKNRRPRLAIKSSQLFC